MLQRKFFKVDQNAQDGDGNTELHGYVSKCKFVAKEMQCLIDKGVNLELRNSTGMTVFLLAVSLRQKNMIETLIENGADVQTCDDLGNNALHYLSLPQFSYGYEKDANKIKVVYEILEILLKEGIDVNSVNKKGQSPLMFAASGYDFNIVETLLKFGANVHLQDPNWSTCLHYATLFHASVYLGIHQRNLAKSKLISILIINKACVNCFNLRQCTAFSNFFLPVLRNNFFVREALKTAALVHWKRKIVFQTSISRVLGDQESENEVVAYVDFCYLEIDRLKVYTLPGGYNLCEFACGAVAENELKRTPEIKDEVLKILVKVSFLFYEEFILTNLGKPYFRDKVRNLEIFARNKDISLNSDTVYKLSSYLENSDILNLFLAFPEQLKFDKVIDSN